MTALASLVEAQPATEGQARVKLRILPLESFEARGHGKRLTVGSLSRAKEIVANSLALAGAQELPLDYDHQTVFGAKDGVGGTAPASGWIKALSAEADGIYADIEWTARAAEKIRAKEYRYLSPVVRHDAKGVIHSIANVALTNTPSIDGLTQLAASNPLKESEMDLTALALSLGLPATATLEEITAKQAEQATALSALQAEVAALRLAAGGTDQATALSAITALRTAAASAPEVAALTAQLQGQVATLNRTRIEGVVDGFIAKGQVTPAQRDHYIALALKDEATALSLMGASPVVVNPSPTAEREQQAAITALSADQKQLCALTGVAEADLLASLNGGAK